MINILLPSGMSVTSQPIIYTDNRPFLVLDIILTGICVLLPSVPATSTSRAHD